MNGDSHGLLITVIIEFAMLSYLLGAIPNGFLIAKAKGIDIRKVGSGNIGATNVYRSVSKSLGLLTFALDALKGAIPALLFPIWVARCVPASALPFWAPLLFGGLAIAGHTWPVYLKFKGGKGVATSAGALIGIAPAAMGIGVLCWLIALVTTRFMSVASVVAAVTVPAVGWWRYREQGLALPIALTALGALIIWRHKGNIQRLMNGTESRFEFKKKSESRSQNPGDRD
ncbi:MAG: glycerol-3-phosphate 1-O-acyltransferase PlsY [bacterium]